MKLAFLFCLFCLINIIYSQDCGIVGPYTCTGGTILGMEFGDDDDDDFFEYFASFGDTQTDNSCSILQQGTKSVSGDTITVEFEIDDDECVITGDASAGCDCLNSLTITTSSNCVSVFGPNGEQCESSDECADSFSCPNGETPQDDPNVEPSANGCGPSAFPLAGPSFSFLECCEQHDFCYGTCGASKLQCDNDFYSCMFCSCGEAYDNFFSELACEELACSYFQAVEEFGCPAFTSGQEEACTCPSSKSESKIIEDNQQIPNKFGGIPPTMRQTKLICDEPFTVTCPDNDDGDTPATPVTPDSPATPVTPVTPNSPDTISFTTFTSFSSYTSLFTTFSTFFTSFSSFTSAFSNFTSFFSSFDTSFSSQSSSSSGNSSNGNIIGITSTLLLTLLFVN